MPAKKIDTEGRDMVISIVVHFPNGSQNRARIVVQNAKGSASGSRLTLDTITNCLVSGLSRVFGRKIKVD